MLEIVCNVGDPRLGKTAEIIVRNAAESVLLSAGRPLNRRIVLSFRPEDGSEEDILILLYRGEHPPVFTMPRGGVLPSPYSIEVLEGMVRSLVYAAVMEAEQTENDTAEETLTAAEPRFLGRRVTLGNISVPLTKTEAAVFAILYEHRGTPVSRERLSEAVWGKKTQTNLCDVYVCRLRSGLEPIFGKGFLVHIRNEGYMMV